MVLKQVSLALPKNLLDDSKKYASEYGYKNIQELILDLIRERIYFKRIQRYQRLEKEMDANKDTKHFTQEEAVEYFENF